MSGLAEEQFGQLAQTMGAIGEAAASSSRTEHTYVNRTGDAEGGTMSVTEQEGDTVYMLVAMTAPYSSYLMQGGTAHRSESLTGLEDAIDVATAKLDTYIDGLGVALSTND